MKQFSQRLAGLDAARATLMLLGLVVHAGAQALTYQKPTSSVADGIAMGATILAHNFRMPAFFMLSGFLGAMLIGSRGVAGFTRQRVRRLVYPLIAACFTILPLTYLAAGGNPTAQADIVGNGFLHLWFIYYLIFFSAVLALLQIVLSKIGKSLVSESVRPLGGWLVNPMSILLFIALCLVLPGWFNSTSLSIAQDSSLFPPVGLVVFYAIFFAFGTLLYRYWGSAEKWFGRFGFVYLVLGVAGFTVYALQLWGAMDIWFSQTFYTLSTWMLALAVLSLFVRYFKKQSRVAKYLSESSYWIYLVHMPLMFLTQRLFAQLHLGVALSFWLALPLVFAIAIGLYQLLVRDRFIGKLLAGQL